VSLKSFLKLSNYKGTISQNVSNDFMKGLIFEMFGFEMSNVSTVFTYSGDYDLPVDELHALYGGGSISDVWAGAVALGSVGGYAVISDEFMMAVTAGHCFTYNPRMNSMTSLYTVLDLLNGIVHL